MASKQLTATVRLNTTQAEKSIDRLVNKINRINNVLNKTSNGSSTKLPKNINKCTTATQQWATALNSVNSKLNGSKSLVKSIGSGLKTLADRYLGVMGMGVVINTSDAITSAENKLNYVSAQNLGASGTNSDGSYSTATLNATQDAMDKMYTSAQKVRMSYTDMMANVSKSMALAGDSFKGNTDMAIRFQEIMAEAYAVGGASAQEMSSSMYQMIQALGAGTLAGDELRSVREGAPLAYQAIEEFAQGVYNTEESLKDLASQGKITSDMVVAAIMNAGNEMDSAFAQTEQTFAQTWTQIKNAAMRAFTPVAKYLRKALNKAIDNGLIKKFETFFANVAKGVVIVFKVIENSINWIADNWDWLKHVLVGVLIAIITYETLAGLVGVASAILNAISWLQTASAITICGVSMLTILGIIGLVIAGVLALIYVFYLWKTGAISTVDAIVYALIVLAVVFVLVAALCTAGIYLIIAAIILAIAAILYWFEYVAGAVTWFGILCKNIGLEIANFFIALSWVIANAFMTAVEFIVDIFNGCCSWVAALCTNLGETIGNIATNIGIAFQNAWIGAQNMFWSFIKDCLEGIRDLEPAINAVAKAFGAEGFTLSGVIDNVAGKQQSYKEYVKVNAFDAGWSSDAWNKGTSKWTAPKWDEDSSWSEKINTLDAFEKGWSQDAFNIGYDWGKGIKDSINQWGSQWQNSEHGLEIDDIMKALGLDPDEFDKLFDPKKVKDLLGGGFGDLLGDTGDIAGNTGKMADSMELTEEDLKYLRSIAEMEWKKEYTTANIKIDMTNNNNINGESDLDGIVTKLSDKLYEELNIIADGVYAY